MQQGSAGAVSVPQTAAHGVLVTVHLPLRNSDQLDALIARQGDKSSSDYHRWLTPAQFRAAYAPSASDLAAATSALKSLGFTSAYATSQSVVAAAPQAVVERAFGVHLTSAQAKNLTTSSTRASVLVADRAPTLSAQLAQLGATIAFSPYVRTVDSRRTSSTALNLTGDNRYSNVGPYWFTDLKQAYGYPSYAVANGSGRTIAIVIDSDVNDADTALYFGHEALTPPVVLRRPVDGPPPAFNPASGSSFEASLDVQQAGGSAPGAQIMLYTIPDLSDQSTYDAYSAIVEDNQADVVSSSFGLCELYYTAAYNRGTDLTVILQDFHDVFRQGNAQGITFVAASGDNGAYGCLDPTGSHFVKGVQNPADDSAVTAVGGTDLVTTHGSATSPYTSAYVKESEFYDPIGTVPNDIWGSGGGVSRFFKKPPYQTLVNTRSNMRTIPDVSMHMGGCPQGASSCQPDDSSDVVVVAGGGYAVIGTSASSPDFAGLLAVTEQTLGTRLGNANYYAYALALAGDAAYHRNIPGDNGYPSAPGYDYVTGIGTPRAAVFAAQPFAPVAGNPGTPSNP